jgi:hypothetical protein
MITLKKPTKDGSLHLHTVVDTRERNANVRTLASQLPDIEDAHEQTCGKHCSPHLMGQ